MASTIRRAAGSLTVLLMCYLTFYGATVRCQQPEQPSPWEPVRFMLGEWKGDARGASGTGTSARTYAFVLKNRYLYERNVSTYPPQESNKKGEVHEHWAFISYDRARKRLVLRQFHQEGFVNQYVMDPSVSSANRLVFVSETFENLDPAWKARESYDITSANEFIETFEVAEPGKTWEVYSRTQFKRVK